MNLCAIDMRPVHRGGAGGGHRGLLPLQLGEKSIGAHQKDTGVPVMPALGEHCLGPVVRRLLDKAPHRVDAGRARDRIRSEEHTSELQSLMRISYAVFCLKKKTPSKTIYY